MIWASRRWPKFDRSSRNSKKIKKMWNLGTLPLFHTYYPLRLRNLSYNKWFTHLFTNMNNMVEGSLNVRQMWWIMTISKANIVQMASNLAHGCILAWQWMFTLGVTKVVEEEMVILQFVVNMGFLCVTHLILHIFWELPYWKFLEVNNVDKFKTRLTQLVSLNLEL